MRNDTSSDFSRRDLDFRTPKVAEVLPEYFKGDYPNLIALLETYYDYLDSDGSFNEDLRGLLKAKDIDGVSLKFLNYLLKETAPSLAAQNLDNPREVLKYIPDFYRSKGSLFSVKMFFRALYGEDVDVVYPKDQLFIVGESLIGPEGDILQNGELYQVLSILIKSALPISVWKTAYKELVHPAGFYVGNEVLLSATATINAYAPDAILDSDNAVSGYNTIAETASITISAPNHPLIGTYTDSDGTQTISLDTVGNNISTVQLSQLDSDYSSVADLIKTTSPTFDEDSDAIDYSNTFETFDKN